jgi:hypothetical protein
MRISKEALGTSVVVRRVWVGATPFRWEVSRADSAAPVYVSSDRFRSMHDAYLAGQARLADFLPKRSMPPGVTENREWQSHQIGPSGSEAMA